LTTFVADASVAAKWLLPGKSEPLHEEAMEWLGRYVQGEIRLIVPDLFWAELANILWKAIRQGRSTKTAGQSALHTLQEFQIPTISSLALLDLAFAIANAYERTVYDSLYVALAVHFKAQLVTADEKLANALAAHLPVKWLGAI
jgi:predicted nucleic acid-binding protein